MHGSPHTKDGGRKGTKWFIHFSGDDWWQSNPHSRHHITRQFQQAGYRVLWINPMGLRFPSIRKHGFWRKIARKLKSIVRSLRQADDGTLVFTFVFLPVFSQGWAERVNRRLIGAQMSILLLRLGIKQAVGFVTLPTFAPVVRALKNAGRLHPIVYYYSDQYDKYREIRDPAPIIAWDRMLQEDADAIYCASARILEHVGEHIRRAKPVRVVDHQVDFDAFDYTRIDPVSVDVGKPIIGYFGSLTDSNDWEMIEFAARARPHWSFVFVGKKLIDLPSLEELPNVFFWGFVPYDKLPAVAANFDVGIMFWKMTDWIRACSPLKLKEYLALGLPVVSVPIDEVREKYSDYVEFASDGPEFVGAVERALAAPDREARRAFARQFSWRQAVLGIRHDIGLGEA